MARRAFLLIYPDAEQTIAELAVPELARTALAIAGAIPENVPVDDGTMRASYQPSVRATDEAAQVYPGSPFWHWLEYGTRFSPPYRPAQTGIERAGVRYEAR